MPPWLVSFSKQAEPYWALVLFIAVPVAGFVGFLLNLSSLRKTRLENRRLIDELARSAKTSEKLDLEVAALKRVAMQAEKTEEKEARVIKTFDLVEMSALVGEDLRRGPVQQRVGYPPPASASAPVLWWLILLVLAIIGLIVVLVRIFLHLMH